MMINLIPTKVKKNVRFAKYNVLTIRYIILTLLFITVLTGLMLYSKSTLTNAQTELNASVEESKARAGQLKDVNDQATDLSNTVTTISNILDQEVKFSLLLKEVGAFMPPGAKLSSLTLSRDSLKPIRLSVQLDTAEKAGVLQQNIIESDLFVSADILNVNNSNQSEAYKFSGDLQAYYDPDFPLTSLGKITEENAQ